MDKPSLYINGELRAGRTGRTYTVLNPAINEPLAEVPRASAEDVNDAVQAAASAGADPAWRDLEVATRVEMLRRVSRGILERLDALASLEAQDTGNPISDVRRFYLPGAAACFDFYPSLAYHLAGQQIPISPTRLDYTSYEPLGVVAVIVPWNDPLEIACGRLATALAAGNTCVLKPSPLAPLSCLELGTIFAEAGLPAGVVNIITGLDDESGMPLISHPLVRMISFTGSVQTGQLIQQTAALHTQRVSLEMGGKSANLVLADADLERAVPALAQAIYLMSGQNCVAGSRLLVPEQLHDDLLDRLIAESAKYTLGDPLDPATVLGPLISPRQLERVVGAVRGAIQQGCRVVLGGSPPEDARLSRGNYYLPTILTDVGPEMSVAQEEVFGPVLSVLSYRSIEEAIAICNGTLYGLGAGIWTRDLGSAHRLARQIQAGTVYVNTYNEFYLQSPFGGLKRSGIGHEYGLDALREYSQLKNVIVNTAV